MALAGDTHTLNQLVLGRKDVQDLSDTEQELPPDLMTVNMGPSHPAMHGTVRIVLTVDGEKIMDQARRTDPRIPQTTSTTNYRRRTLAFKKPIELIGPLLLR